MENEDKVKGQIKNLEHEIARLRKALKEKDKTSSVGQQIARMDHYIKNILNKLEGGSYMVNTGLRKNKPEILSRGWRIVETNLNKVSDLVMNLLLVSKKSEKDHEWCSPNDIAQDVYDLLAQRSGRYRVDLSKAFEPDLDECYLGMKEVHRCLLIVSGCPLSRGSGRRQARAVSIIPEPAVFFGLGTGQPPGGNSHAYRSDLSANRNRHRPGADPRLCPGGGRSRL